MDLTDGLWVRDLKSLQEMGKQTDELKQELPHQSAPVCEYHILWHVGVFFNGSQRTEGDVQSKRMFKDLLRLNTEEALKMNRSVLWKMAKCSIVIYPE